MAQNVVRDQPADGRVEARQKQRVEISRGPDLAEIRALIPHLGEGQGRPLMLTAIFTGLRASGLRGLAWQDVDLDGGVRAPARRSLLTDRPAQVACRRRSISLMPMLVNTLRNWNSFVRRTRPASSSRRAQPLTLPTIVDDRLASGAARGRSRQRQRRAEIFGFHALRHFYVEWCIDEADGGLELPIRSPRSTSGTPRFR